MSDLFISTRSRPLGEVRTCPSCGFDIVRVERVFGGFDLAEVVDLHVRDGERHNPNCAAGLALGH